MSSSYVTEEQLSNLTFLLRFSIFIKNAFHGKCEMYASLVQGLLILFISKQIQYIRQYIYYTPIPDTEFGLETTSCTLCKNLVTGNRWKNQY